MKKKMIKILAVILLLIGTNFLTYNAAIYGYGNASSTKYARIKFLEDYVKKNFLYPVTDEDFEIGELKGVIAGLNDPYSEYMTKEEYDKLMETTSGKFYGIGVVITKGEDNLITVISPIKGSPADKAGVKAQDKIIKVEGVEYTAEKMNDAIAVMKGKKGTKVNITVYTPSTSETRDLSMERDEVKMETIISKKINNIGYIAITQFDETTYPDFKEALNKLEREDVKGLVIDLRGNPGGVVDAAANIADELLPEGMIVYAKDKNEKTVFEFKSDSNQTELPITVLINKGSASASEILAGALHDHKRATIIGTTSFGKGIVQSAARFPKGDGIKLTTSQYFTPNGVCIHKIGIKPDIEIEIEKDAKGIGVEYLDTDTQLKKSIEVLNESINKESQH